MRLGSDRICVIARGAYLHDIGKMAIPEVILLKPEALDPDEQEIMRQHCQRGYEIVRKSPSLRTSRNRLRTSRKV